MLTEELKDSLDKRYALHPLIFSRSVGRAKNNADLFDILDSFPQKFPVVWSEEEFKWITTSDPYLFQDFDFT
jgi:hypothetical protein